MFKDLRQRKLRPEGFEPPTLGSEDRRKATSKPKNQLTQSIKNQQVTLRVAIFYSLKNYEKHTRISGKDLGSRKILNIYLNFILDTSRSESTFYRLSILQPRQHHLFHQRFRNVRGQE